MTLVTNQLPSLNFNKQSGLTSAMRSVTANVGHAGFCRKGLFQTAAQPGNDGFQNLEVFFAESVLIQAVKRQHRRNPDASFDGDSQGGAHRDSLRRIVEISRFYQGIAIQDRFVILRHQPDKPFPRGTFKEENSRKFSPLTNSATSKSFLRR